MNVKKENLLIGSLEEANDAKIFEKERIAQWTTQCESWFEFQRCSLGLGIIIWLRHQLVSTIEQNLKERGSV
jgi:hypothetical protein